MKNFERYIDEVSKALTENIVCTKFIETINAPWECNMECDECEENLKEYLLSEYKEPPVDWNKVVVDTPILVSDDGEEWFKRCFAKFERGKVYAWSDGRNSWTTLSDDVELWKYAKLAEEE